jgi:hypothetical protein
MPVAVANLQETVRKDLKTCPGGYVVLRPMNYGQVIARREMLKMSVSSAKGSKDFKGEMAMASKEITRFEFGHCVVEHNLEKEEGVPLNLSAAGDFDLLDPRVGQEIEKYIGEMNNFEDEDDEGN